MRTISNSAGLVEILETLSEHAREVLCAVELRRESPALGSVESTRARLRADGLPCSPAILSFEQRFGGLVVKGHSYGIGQALAGHEALWARGDYEPAQYLGRPLVPITPPANTELWIDEVGTVCLVDADVDFCAPTDESFVHRLENDAFIFEHFGDLGPSPRPYSVVAYALMGDRIAGALGVPAFLPATDRYTKTWWADDICIQELEIPGYRHDTTVYAATLSLARRAAEVAREVEPDATVRGRCLT